MSSREKARAAFLSAMGLLLLSGGAAYVAITHLVESEKWVIHSHEVRDTIGEVDWGISNAARVRSGYMISDSDDLLAQFEGAIPEVVRKLQHLRDLTEDNPRQRELCARLEDVTARRIAILQESMENKQETPGSEQRLQAEFARKNLPLSNEMTTVVRQMRQEEQRLLDVREAATHRLFVATVLILSVAFVLAFLLFSIQYRFLSMELKARQQAERAAVESEESLRQLTARLLQVQDAERRRFSRELHDSLGQYLAAVKMNLEMFATRRDDGLLAEATQLLDQSIGETRTISHLLHPPLLDEAGFASAAKWYLEGFAQRSGIEINVELPEDVGNLARPVALGLFRVLQESLTNIHRHSGSAKADVVLSLQPGEVTLKVRDYGKGIAPDLLKTFRTKGTKSGVGLAGMRERIRELGGHLNIQSITPGVLISVTMPISESMHETAAD